MKLKLLIVALFCSVLGWGQTNPTAQTLPYSFTSLGTTTLPAGMAVHRFGTSAGAIPTTRTTFPATGDLPNVTIANSGGWMAENANGVSMLASGSQSAGAVVVAINTTGNTNILVQWKAGTVLQQTSLDNSVALQYRIGTTGTWTDVGTTTTYTSQGKVAGDVSAVLSENLPAAADNQAVVQVRWVYWVSNGASGSRDRINIDDISITGTTGCVAAAITTQPSTTVQNLCQGNSATALSVTATGTTLSYQWYSNTTATTSGGTPVGTNSNSYTPVTTTAGTLYYYCVVSAACGASVTSNVSGAVNVTAIPSAPSGTINVSANPSCGAATLTYSAPNANIYWQTSATGNLTTNPTTSSYTSSATAGSHTIYVRELNGTCWGPATSVTFTVVAPVNITGQPTNQSATTGNTATFSVTASNAAGYQWQINTGSGWSDIAGATTASYTTPATTLAMNGYQYQVVITGNAPCGNVTSSAATLSVTTGPCFTDNFNSGYGTWSGGSGTYNNSTAGNTGNGVGFNDVNDDIITNVAITNPQSIQFQLASSSTSANKTISIEYATSATGPWTTVRNILNSEVSTSFTLFTTNLNLTGAYYLRIVMSSRTGGSYYLDNVDVFCQAISGPEINITGNGTNIADNDTTPAAIDGTNLGTVALSTNITQTFTIQNIGTTNLVLSGPVTLTDVSAPQEFVISQPAITTIPAGGSTTFTVTFNSAVAGTFTNTINIGSNDTDEALYNFNIVATATNTPTGGTVFRPGDLIFVGYDSTVSAAADCSGTAQMDKLYVANLVDISPGTEFMVVNSRYESGAAANVRTDRWYSGSTDPYDDPGIITFKWNGVAPIVAGSIITFKANVFTVSDIRINDVVTTDFGVTTNANQCNISSTESDQIYIMQGTFTSFGTIGTNRYNLFNGNVLFGLTNGANWVPFTSGVSAANSPAGRVSRLPEDLECFNIESSSLEGVRFYRNSGLHTGSKNQILGAIMNLGNWSAPLNDNCLSTTENFSPSANDNAVGKPFTITPSNPDGTWTGFTDTDWFKCSNWEGLAVPKPITDVIIPNVVNQPRIGASPAKFPTGAFSKNLTINNGSSLTMNTAASRLNLYGNWTNDAGNAAFVEGNGTVYFNGTTPQIINAVTPAGTEVFYNVVLNNSFDTSVSNDLVAEGNLVINSGRVLNIDGAGYVRVNNRLTHNGDLTIQNNGQFIQVNETDTNDGVYTGTKFQVNRAAQVRNLDYVFWSSPVENFAVSSLPNSNRYYWNTLAANANGTLGNWANASGNMAKGQGYIARASNGAATAQAMNLIFSGKPNNGAFTLPIQRGIFDGADYDAEPANSNNVFTTKYDDNWNLVGNPYPSAIDAEEFLVANQTKIEGAVWVWTHGLLPTSITDPFYNNYQYNYSATDYIKYNGLGSTDPDTFAGKISSGQGFMVNMLHVASTPNTIDFNNSFRTGVGYANYNNSDFFRNASVAESFEDQEKHRVWLDVVNTTTGQSDRTLLGYASNATHGRDHFYDCIHKPNTTVSFYSLIDKEPFIIQGRSLPFDVNDRVPMGLSVGATSNITIAIRKADGIFAQGQTVYLEDKQLNIIHNLSTAPYVFTSNAGIFSERFIIRYTNETLSNDDFENDSNILISSSDVITVYSSNETIQSIQIHNVLGQLLVNQKNVNADTFEINTLQKNKAPLIIQVTLENGKKINKKLIF